MAYEVQIIEVEPQRLAVVRRTAALSELPTVLPAAFDAVWKLIHAQNVPFGHNATVYESTWQGPTGELTFDCVIGVEVNGPFHAEGDVEAGQTPGGRVATTTLLGPYSELAGVYAYLRDWLPANGYEAAGATWEVYGDWTEDESKLRTDVFFALKPTVQA